MARKTNPISLRLNINRSPDGLWWSSRYYDQVFMRDFHLRQLMKAHLRKSPLPIIRFGLAGSPHKQQCVLYLTKLQQNHWIPRNNPESKLMRWRQRQKQKLLREQRLLIQDGQRIHWKKVAKARSKKKYPEALVRILSKVTGLNRKIALSQKFWKRQGKANKWIIKARIRAHHKQQNRCFQREIAIKRSLDNNLMSFNQFHKEWRALTRVEKITRLFTLFYLENKSSLKATGEIKEDSKVFLKKSRINQKGVTLLSWIEPDKQLGSLFRQYKAHQLYSVQRAPHALFRQLKDETQGDLGMNLGVTSCRSHSMYNSAESIVLFLKRMIPKRRISPKRILNKIEYHCRVLMSMRQLQGVRITLSGRIRGRRIASTMSRQVGCISRHTLNAQVDYASDSVIIGAGKIGIKVWLCFPITKNK